MRAVRFLLLLAVVFLTACGARPINIVPSSSPVEAGTRGTEFVTATNCQTNLLGLIPISLSASLPDALEEAKKKAKAKVLTDISIEEEFRYFILASTHCVRVSGFAVKDAGVQSRSL